MFSKNSLTKFKKSHITFNKIHVSSENIDVYIIIRTKCCTARHRTHDNIILRMTFECLLEMATDTQSEIVELIAFSRQQKLHSHTTMLKFYVHCLTCFVFVLENCAFDLH